MSHDQGKLKYLMNDFVVQEHVCNLRCSYCLNFENENLKPGEPWKPIARVTLKEGSFGWQRARKVLETCREQGDAPILRVAGGEVLAIPGAVDFLQEVADDWDRLQILTNAVFLTRDIDRLQRIDNLNLCCSLDGHTPELNALRTPQEKWARKIIEGVTAAVHAGIPVEVYTVLTTHNARSLYDFACWLLELPRSADLRLLPFPVRGNAAKGTLPGPEDFQDVGRLIDEFDRFRAILPPARYLERLWQVGTSSERVNRCRIPLSIMQSFDDGLLAACTNCWAAPLGNMLEDDDPFARIGKANIHKLFLRNPPRVPFCNGCFTPFDVVNVFLDGDCRLEEVTAMDLYSSPAARDRLKELRAQWEDESCRNPLRSPQMPSHARNQSHV